MTWGTHRSLFHPYGDIGVALMDHKVCFKGREALRVQPHGQKVKGGALASGE
jgi:hypothetical protein